MLWWISDLMFWPLKLLSAGILLLKDTESKSQYKSYLQLLQKNVNLGVHVPSAMFSGGLFLCLCAQQLLPLLLFPNQVWFWNSCSVNQAWFSNSCSVNPVCILKVQNKAANCRWPALQERMKDMVFFGPDLLYLRSCALSVHNWFCARLVCVWWVIYEHWDCTGKRKWLQKWRRLPI